MVSIQRDRPFFVFCFSSSNKIEATHEFTFQQGHAVFLEQVPMSERTWRTRRWGKDLRVRMVKGRDFRNANTDPKDVESLNCRAISDGKKHHVSCAGFEPHCAKGR